MITTHPSPLVAGPLRFVDNIHLIGGRNGEFQFLTNRLVDRARTYEMEVSTKKSKVMTNSTNNVNADISMNSQKLEEVTSFKYLGATLCKDGTRSAEMGIRIAPAMAEMARLNGIYRCWLWRKKILAFESTCLRKLFRVFFLEHKTNNWVRNKINFLVGPQESLPAALKRRKRAWFGHVTHRNSFSKTILQGTLEGGQSRGRQRKCWMNDTKRVLFKLHSTSS